HAPSATWGVAQGAERNVGSSPSVPSATLGLAPACRAQRWVPVAGVETYPRLPSRPWLGRRGFGWDAADIVGAPSSSGAVSMVRQAPRTGSPMRRIAIDSRVSLVYRRMNANMGRRPMIRDIGV